MMWVLVLPAPDTQELSFPVAEQLVGGPVAREAGFISRL